MRALLAIIIPFILNQNKVLNLNIHVLLAHRLSLQETWVYYVSNKMILVTITQIIITIGLAAPVSTLLLP